MHYIINFMLFSILVLNIGYWVSKYSHKVQHIITDFNLKRVSKLVFATNILFAYNTQGSIILREIKGCKVH